MYWRTVTLGRQGCWMSSRRCRSEPVIPSSAFKGFRFPSEIIVLAVRWYLRYGLSYRDLEELLAERGIEVDHVTVFRWCSASRRSSRTRLDRVAMRSMIVGSWTRRT